MENDYSELDTTKYLIGLQVFLLILGCVLAGYILTFGAPMVGWLFNSSADSGEVLVFVFFFPYLLICGGASLVIDIPNLLLAVRTRKSGTPAKRGFGTFNVIMNIILLLITLVVAIAFFVFMVKNKAA